ncbi:Rap1a/Tai family immunity protein [Microbulbifer harenosus]|uniref:Rap1a immunity protein domain-containing protein n=1 Tax=Microbulbifer harenosus TaxID=2576840 RepID=A0ABY2UKQ5_9GAMM|nr:Rap1a/Tai family immunity protein [Microbulbifer harenosus]TLM78989.1 hypothetical protein FDY93_02435 [Microbulbifer harenosus]
MRFGKYIYATLACVGIISCDAQSQSIKIPSDEKQRLSIENLNFKGSDFLSAYMSRDMQQRRLAEMYLSGVLDSTEGIFWCGYKVALPGSIQEQVYVALKSADQTTLNKRASEIITSALSEKLPCKEEE